MGFFKAIITFVFGMILSYLVGAIFSDSGIATATAVCYVGAIIVGTSHNNKRHDT